MLAASSNSMPFPQHDLPVHKCFLRNLVLGHAREYLKTTHALAPVFFAPTSFDTALAFTTLHPQSNCCFPLFLEDYEPDQDFKFFSNSFKLTFQHMLHLLVNGHFGMVF